MSPRAQLSLSLADAPSRAETQVLATGAVLLRGFALAAEAELHAAVARVAAAAPFRHMVTPGGLRMSVAMTNCGALGWVSSAAGYRYVAADPDSGRPWSPMPESFAQLATSAAARAGFALGDSEPVRGFRSGFDAFVPDACLVNRYDPGARLTLHQDKDERDFGAPIVSVSLGLPATFLFGGPRRADRPQRVPLRHGDVVVWGGPSRLHYHGVLALADGEHPLFGAHRINLTFRKAG